jgi:hypothetical protein
MNRVSEKCHTSGKHDDDDLESGGGEQSNERPLDGPDSSLGGQNRWIDRTVGMDMSVLSIIMLVVFLMSILMTRHI